METMDINELRTGKVDGGFTDPNLKRNPPKKREVREIDPVKELGLKSQAELDRENPDMRVAEDKIYDDFDAMIERKKKEAANFEDLYEQSEGDVTYEDIVDMDNGFDPIAMMKNPPRPGHINTSMEQKRDILRSQGFSEEEIDEYLEKGSSMKSMKREPSAKVETPAKVYPEPISYENDEIDEDAELEKEIMEGIPEEDEYIEPPVDEDVRDSYETNQPISLEEYDKPIDNSSVLPEIPDTQIDIGDRSEDDDLKALDDDVKDSTEDEITKKRLQLLKDGINSKIRPVANKFDISTFTISKSPVNINNSIKQAELASPVKRADWVLFGSNRPVTMRSFRGSELNILVQDASNRNPIQAARERYGLFYNHIEDPYKPADLDSWAKTIAVVDIDHLYACAYRSSFEGVNFLPYDCQNPKCNHSFVTDSVPFLDLVKFKDDKAKRKYEKLIKQPLTPDHSKFEAEIVPISDTFAFGLRMPSIYDIVFVDGLLDEQFKEKYKDVIGIAPYIDSMWYIDIANSSLRPLNVKVYRDNIVKTTKAKIITLAKIIKELTSDQYNLLKIYTSKIIDEEDAISYVLPSVTCEKCKNEIPETQYSASQLLFLRHHLASLVNG